MKKNYKILIDCFTNLILHSNEKIRNQTLSDFSNCINSRLKTGDSSLYELGKNQIFGNILSTKF